MNKFNIGDKVRILVDYERKGGFPINSIGTVTEYSSAPFVELNGNLWAYTEDEIELVTEEKPRERFKVGDKVTVVKVIHGGEYPVGTKCTVEGVNEDNYSITNGDDFWYYTDEELEPTKEEETTSPQRITVNGIEYVMKPHIVEILESSGVNPGDVKVDPSKIDLIYDKYCDFKTLPVDTELLVSTDGKYWLRRHFAKYEDGKVWVFGGGRTSFSAEERKNHRSSHFKFAKLA